MAIQTLKTADGDRIEMLQASHDIVSLELELEITQKGFTCDNLRFCISELGLFGACRHGFIYKSEIFSPFWMFCLIDIFKIKIQDLGLRDGSRHSAVIFGSKSVAWYRK